LFDCCCHCGKLNYSKPIEDVHSSELPKLTRVKVGGCRCIFASRRERASASIFLEWMTVGVRLSCLVHFQAENTVQTVSQESSTGQHW